MFYVQLSPLCLTGHHVARELLFRHWRQVCLSVSLKPTCLKQQCVCFLYTLL